jgi:hypothetical protein
MIDTAVTTSTDFEDSDPIDFDRLAASLDHLRAHFCQRAGNDAAPSSSDVCERVASSDGDRHHGDLDQPAARVAA